MDLLVIGAGLSGAVIANRFAKSGKKVLILEKRNNVGGNIYDKKINGVTTHIYGPHIFHTDDERVVKFMNSFWELNEFKNKVKGMVQDKIVPIPFNFEGIDKFWPAEAEEIKEKLKQKYGLNKRVTIFELRNQDDEQLRKVADFVYDNIFENYTSKMWGLDPTEIDQSVTNRVPVAIGYSERYFSNKYEGIPKDGYTTTIEKMLNHKNIEVRLEQDASKLLEKKESRIFFEDLEVTCPIIYSGPIDELFEYKYENLNYRSLDIKFEEVNEKEFQVGAVVNYPADPVMTRIVEYKKMTFEESDNTIISKEYPGEYEVGHKIFGEPYYPMATEVSRKQYNKYKELASNYKNLHLVGRLATYQYLDMDKTIALALLKADELLK